MKTKRDEAWLRSWLRAGWDDAERGPLGWIEPGRGATVGMPDCLLPIGQVWIPAELKAAVSLHANYSFFARATQSRFHRLARMRGFATIFLVVCADDIIAFPFDLRLKKGVRVAGCSITSVDHLVRMLEKDAFWQDFPQYLR